MKILLEKWKEILSLLFIVALFVLAGVFAQSYSDQIAIFMEGKYVAGLLIYMIFVIVAFVVAPINSLPLLPVVVSIWGLPIAFISSLIAWTIGGNLTYFLSAKFGRPIVLRFVSEEQIEKYSKIVPEKNKFLAIVILQALFPGDILGYVLGLFMKYSHIKYAIASTLGNIPFGIVLVYASSLSVQGQFSIGAVLILILAVSVWGISEKVRIQ